MPILDWLRPAAKGFTRLALGGYGRWLSRDWPLYSRLFLVSDSTLWTITEDMAALAQTAGRLHIPLAPPRWRKYIPQQAAFLGSHFTMQDEDFMAPLYRQRHRLGTAYFHGVPGSGFPEFDKAYQYLCRSHQRIDRVQVTHAEMENVVLSSGIAAEKVFRIPIGINLASFPTVTAEGRMAARQKYGIPSTAMVVGSFQKDGVGWGDGSEPKLIKGPDVFLRTLELLQPKVPELYVMLTGPARGYVKKGLERLGIPYAHVYLEHYHEIGFVYQALDAYLVASRQEGGPKAVLEAQAVGIPLVSTRVGQATDLIQHGQTGWLADVGDAEALSHWVLAAFQQGDWGTYRVAARQSAQKNDYIAQTPQWAAFMNGFVTGWEGNYAAAEAA